MESQIISLTNETTPQIILLGIIFTLAVIYVVRNKGPGGRDRLPPGPFSISGIGCPWKKGMSRREVYKSFSVLKEEFGDIFSINLVMGCNIVINTHELLREAFTKNGDVTSGRPWTFIRKHITKNTGILSTDGAIWKAQRRFTIAALRDLGMGKSAIIPAIHEEISKLITTLKENEGKQFNPQFPLGVSVSNVICSLVFGVRTHSNYSETSKKVLAAMNDNATSINLSILRFPSLRHLPGDLFGFKRFLKNSEVIKAIVCGYIEEHKQNFDPENIGDFVDAYLAQIQSEDNDSDLYNDQQMARSVTDMFFAGSETTSTTLRWALILMAIYPDVQRRVHEEIDEVLGGDRYVDVNDKSKLPFTEAVLLEIQRFAVLVPVIFHRATEDTEISGYFIKKDTVILANLWALHREKKIWKNPDNFDVSNFLDEQGHVINRENLAVFSIGKRQCAGESLARMELFLFYVSLMQSFTFIPPIAGFPSDILDKTKHGIVRSPPLYEIRAITRT